MEFRCLCSHSTPLVAIFQQFNSQNSPGLIVVPNQTQVLNLRSNGKTWVATVTPTQLQTGHQLWLYCWFEPNIYQLIPLTYKPIQGKL